MWPSLLRSIALRGPKPEKSNSELYKAIVELMMIFIKSEKPGPGGHLKTMLENIKNNFLDQDVNRLLIDEDAVIIDVTNETKWYTCDNSRTYKFEVKKYALPAIKNELKPPGGEDKQLNKQLFLRQIQFFTFSGVPSFTGNVTNIDTTFEYIGLCSCGIPNLNKFSFPPDPLHEAFDYWGHIKALNLLIEEAQQEKWRKPELEFQETYKKIIPNPEKKKKLESERDKLSQIVKQISDNLSDLEELKKLKSKCQDFYTEIKKTCYKDLNLDWQNIHKIIELTTKQFKQGQIIGQVVLYGGCIRIAYILECALLIHIQKLSGKQNQKAVQEGQTRKPESINELAGQMIPKKKQQEPGPKLSVPSTSTSAPMKVEEVEEKTIAKTKKKKGKGKKKEEEIDEDWELLNAAVARVDIEKKENEDVIMKNLQEEMITNNPQAMLEKLQEKNYRYKWKIKDPDTNEFFRQLDFDEIMQDQKGIEQYILNTYFEGGGRVFYEPYLSKLLDVYLYAKRLSKHDDDDEEIKVRKLKPEIFPSMMIEADRSDIILPEARLIQVKERWSDAFKRYVYQTKDINTGYFDDAFEKDQFTKPDKIPARWMKFHQALTNKLIKEAVSTIVSIRNKILTTRYKYFQILLDNYFSKKDDASLTEIEEIFDTAAWLFANTMYDDDFGSDTSFGSERVMLVNRFIHMFSLSLPESLYLSLRAGFQKLDEKKRVEFTSFLYDQTCRDIMALGQINHFVGAEKPSILYRQLQLSLALLFNLFQWCENDDGCANVIFAEDNIADKLPIWLLDHILRMHKDVRSKWPGVKDELSEMHMLIVYIFNHGWNNLIQWTGTKLIHFILFQETLRYYWSITSEDDQKSIIEDSILSLQVYIDLHDSPN
tara:strand:+ start:7350 stop:9986 length:2637 start_codon:yes stop_codon:yes gene_type:complete